MKHVHDYLQVIEHNPLARRETVHRRGLNLVIIFQLRFDLARNRFQMWLGRCRANDEKIGEGGYFPKIENNDVFRLFVGCEFAADFS